MKDSLPPRLARELATITAMIGIHCRDHHHGEGRQLCPQCRELAAYAAKRLAKCPFQQKKPTCGNCPVHCYAPRYRIEVRIVMRYAGPRMIWVHPLMALRHLLDGRRRAPVAGQRHHNGLSIRDKNRTKP
jgi:hypothetical protein